jgi:aminoglycoside phosphotransferase (APT) family kinase protein
MDERAEQALDGGCQTDGVVRVGETVHRPAHARSDDIRRLLEHLAAAGFDGAPRPLGTDEQGRDVLSYVPGEVVARSPAQLSDARLENAARLIRSFHDATAGTPLAGREEVVCHGDLGPHNIVFDGEAAVAIIDWDADVAPGPRLVDLAHAVWCCADVCEEQVETVEQARKLRLMCDAYGWEDPAAVVDEIAARFRRARDAHAAAGRATAVAIFERMMEWMERNGPALKAELLDR